MATLTVFPDEDTESTSVDGRVFRGSVNEVWADIHDGAGNGSTDNAASNICIFLDASATTDRWENITRAIFIFDATALGSLDVISSAVLSLKPAASPIDTFTASQDYTIVSANPASSTALANADYDFTDFGTTEFIDARVDVSSVVSGTYEDHTLNASGIANISDTAVSKFGVLMDMDFDNTDGWENNKESGVNFYQADQADTTSDPKLVITYSVTASGPATLKTLDTVALASIKTVNGVAIASVKTIDTAA